MCLSLSFLSNSYPLLFYLIFVRNAFIFLASFNININKQFICLDLIKKNHLQ